jgi:signal transduction histidine kinase
MRQLKGHTVPAMSHLALVSTDLSAHSRAQAANQLAVPKLAAQNLAAQNLAAQDLRRTTCATFATVGLHVETLQRLSGPSGVKAADAAHALLTRGAALCNTALDRAVNADFRARRRGVDLVQIAHQVIDLLSPTAPKGFCFKAGHEAAGCALADTDEVFRILFNLMSNAVAVANRKANLLETVTIEISTEGTSVTTRVTDDGPVAGLRPRRIVHDQIASLDASRHGYGLAIARELAERNGGTLTLAPSTKGASFALKLPALLSVLPQDRFLGRRAMSL